MELFKIFGTIALDNSGAKKELNETANSAEQAGTSMAQSAEKAESKMASAFSKIGQCAVAVGKVIATGVAVGTVAIAGLAKQSLDAYADYEQLVGGVETLFGAGGMSLEEYAESVGKTTSEIADKYESMIKAQTTVLNNANKAYKTAGLSANEYMETVTGFSASLIQSLEGDTEASAEKANQAIIDMADNANKMGTAIDSIQNAYQGFAKQNYTMLDNLKLGYGGTQEEMKRLIQDASKMIDVQKELGVTVDESSMSFANIVDAISVIQKSMGITGTTAKEASETITGSISAMKSSFSNLLAGFGKDDVDLSALTDEFVESFTTVINNVIPRLQVILGGITEVIAQIVPVIAEKLPEMLDSLLPSLLESAVALVNGLILALPTVLQILIEQLPSILTQLGTALATVFPQLLETIKGLFGQVWDYFAVELPGVHGVFESYMTQMSELFSWLWEYFRYIWDAVGQPIWDAISYTFQYVKENWDSVSESISTVFQVMWDYLDTVWKDIGQPIWDMISFAVNSVMDLFKDNMPAIAEFFQNAIAGIKDTWENHLKPVFDAICNVLNNYVKPVFEYVWKNVIEPLITTVFSIVGKLWNETLKPVFDGICDYLTGLFTGNWQKMYEGVMKVLKGLWDGIKNIFGGIWDYLSGVWLKIHETSLGFVKSIVEGAVEKFNALKEKVKEIFEKVKETLSDIWSGIWDTVKGFVNKIIGGVESMVNGVVNGVNNIINGINSVVSKVGELVGLQIAIPTLPNVSLPRLERGGILEKGQVGLLEGNGAEAVVPLDQNEKWITKVAQDMNGAVGDNAILQKILDVLLDLREMLPDELTESIATLKFEINNREFARLVREV